MKYFKLKFLLLFFALAAALPPAWAETVTVTTTISSTNATGTNLGWDNNDLTFTFTQKPTTTNYSVETANPARGLGTGSKTGTHELTSVQEFTNVKKVTVTASTNENGNSLAVKVGNNAIGETTNLTKGDANKKFSFEASSGLNGKIIITINDTKKTVWVKTISVTYETGGDTPVTERVAKPTFSVAGGNYTEAQSVEISCETAGASIYYTLDGTEPSAESTPYDGAITISQTTTLKAIAMKDGMDDSYVATATYTFPMIVTDLAQANRLAAGTEFVYNGYAVVTYVNGNDMWVRDDNGNGGYFYSGISGFSQGDVLKSGWSAKVAEFKGLKEFTNATGLEKNSSAEVTPAKLNISEITNDDISKYVCLENVSADDFANVQWYDKFSTGLTLEAGKSYNVVGIVGYYNKQQFYPITVEEVTAPITELAVTLDPAEKSATAGETIDVTVTANTEAEVIYEYTVTPATATVSETATGFSITSATADTYTVSVYATDGTLEKTVEGTYTFTAAPEPGVMTTYKKVTSTDQVTTGKYLIVYEGGNLAFDGSLETLDAAHNNFEVTITDDKIETDKAAYFTYDASDKTLMSANGKYIGQTKYANGLAQNDDASLTNSVTIDNDGNAVITALESGNTSDQFTTLRFNNAAGDSNDRFRYYKSGQQAIQLYKEFTGGEPAPELATEDKVEFETTVGTPVEKTITVMGENLKGDITLTLTDETRMFSINPATIAMADMTDEGVEVTVTYAPTAEDIHEATITVASKDAKSVTVSLIGMATEPEQVATPKFKNPTGTYTDEVMIDITCETEGATIYFKFNETDPEWYEYNGPMMWRKTTPVYAMATKAGMRDSEVATVTYTIVPAEPVATPTFSLVAGSYTGEQPLTINCETQGATISYSTDGGQNWTEGNTVTLTEDCTVMAKAVKDGMTESAVASATYIIDIPAVPAQIPAIDGYFSITNNETGKYVNVAGRKTITFTDAPDAMAGTVIRVKTNDNGQVQVLRSQAADLQGYANRAMRYVPEIVDMVVNKLNAEGDGQILGNEGLDAIMAKFNECFDYHLYIEEANGGYRLYGKTPSMQPVVEFYRENKAKVDAKLPMLEDFINDAITKLLAKTNGSGASILKPFSVHQTWERMGGTLTEPVDEASTLQFYQEVLNNKNYVWDFAYETAMTYWERLKNHDKYDELKDKLGEFAQYIEKLENVRPDFKYYVVQNGGKIDYISEGNKAITDNAASTIWTLNERATFKVNIPEANKLNTNKYAATLYTDFAYDLPEGVTAYKVTSVTTLGDAVTEAITGTVPAQTPVLLQATTAGEKTLTLNLNDGTAPADNLLVGADYFIKEYEVKTPQLVTLFSYAKDLLGESFYENNIAQYEHLMLKTAGTVNNKYMWGLTSDDLNYCVAINDNGEEDCVVRNLSNGDKGLGFYKNWTAPANQAFLSSDKFNPIRLNLRGDIDRNGVVSISDVSALIDILLALPERPYDPQYDYIAADFNEDGAIKISDVSALIDYLLNMGVNTHIEGD